VSDAEIAAADYATGYRYEIIEGRLCVSPLPNQCHDWLERFLLSALLLDMRLRPEVINNVTNKARVYIPGMRRTTFTKPDLAAYQGWPHERGPQVEWEEVSPLLVGEILSPDNPEKDQTRNVGLYLRVPSIQEYWIADGITNPSEPCLKVYRRWGQKWRTVDVPFDTSYTTRLLPGFELRMNPYQS
jgi:Uma2 family endonuclease